MAEGKEGGGVVTGKEDTCGKCKDSLVSSRLLGAAVRAVERGGEVYVRWAWSDNTRDEEMGPLPAISRLRLLSAKASSIFSRFLKRALALASCSVSLLLQRYWAGSGGGASGWVSEKVGRA